MGRTGPLYAGTTITLLCNVTIGMSVNNNETVSATWSAPCEGCHTFTDAIQESERSFVSSYIISPLADQDGDTYNCSAKIMSNATGVQSHPSSADVTISVAGKSYFQIVCRNFLIYISSELPLPMVSISNNTIGIAGDELVLTCFVTTVYHLATNAQLTVMWREGRGEMTEGEMAYLNETTTVRNLTFSPLSTSHGAEYICQAIIKIPDINVTKAGSDRKDLLVQSNDYCHVCY